MLGEADRHLATKGQNDPGDADSFLTHQRSENSISNCSNKLPRQINGEVDRRTTGQIDKKEIQTSRK